MVKGEFNTRQGVIFRDKVDIGSYMLALNAVNPAMPRYSQHSFDHLVYLQLARGQSTRTCEEKLATGKTSLQILSFALKSALIGRTCAFPQFLEVNGSSRMAPLASRLSHF